MKILTFSEARKRCFSFPFEGPCYRVTEASAGCYSTQQPSSPMICSLLVRDSLLPPSQTNQGCDSSIHSTAATQQQKDEQLRDSHQNGTSISQSSSRRAAGHGPCEYVRTSGPESVVTVWLEFCLHVHQHLLSWALTSLHGSICRRLIPFPT